MANLSYWFDLKIVIESDFIGCVYRYSKNLHIETYIFEMSLLSLLCDEVVPVIRVFVLDTGPNANARRKDNLPFKNSSTMAVYLTTHRLVDQKISMNLTS